MNTDSSAGQFAQILIDDLAQSRPRFIVLPVDVEEHIHHQSTHVLELSRIPARRADFARAWRNIANFVQADYQPVRQFGDEMVWQRDDSLRSEDPQALSSRSR
jgi:hypothetical protein